MSQTRGNGGRISVVIAEDHEQVRRALVDLIGRRPDMVVVGEAADGVEALEHVELREPDILLIDIRMPRMDGIAVLGILRTRQVKTKVIVLSAHEDEAYVAEAMKMGADGFILKGLSLRTIVEAISEVSLGKTFLSPDITRPLIKLFALADSGLAGISRVLERGQDAHDLVRNCLVDIREYFHGDFACLYRTPLAHPYGVSDIFMSSSRPDPLCEEEDIARQWLPEVERNLAGFIEMAEDRKPLVLNDFRPHWAAEGEAGRAVNFVLVPVTNFAGTWGLIICCAEHPFHTSTQGFRYVFSMAAQAGLLLENIRNKVLLDRAEQRIEAMRDTLGEQLGDALEADLPDEAARLMGLASGMEAVLVLAEDPECESLNEIASWNMERDGSLALLTGRLREAMEQVRASGKPVRADLTERESETVLKTSAGCPCLAVLLPLSRASCLGALGILLAGGDEVRFSGPMVEDAGRSIHATDWPGLAMFLVDSRKGLNPRELSLVERFLQGMREYASRASGAEKSATDC